MANKTGVYPVYENQFKIDKTGGTGATAENLCNYCRYGELFGFH